MAVIIISDRIQYEHFYVLAYTSSLINKDIQFRKPIIKANKRFRLKFALFAV